MILQHLAEKALGSLQIAPGGEQEVDGRAVLVDGPVKIMPLSSDLDVRFINPDRAAMGFAEGAQPALDQRGIGQNPAVEGRVVDLQAPLQEHLLDVTIAQRVAQVPGDSLQDQRCLEVPAFKVVLGLAILQNLSISTSA